MYFELYTIHTLVDGETFSLVFALFPGKWRCHYKIFFTSLKTAFTRSQFHPTQQTFFIDNKAVVQNSESSSFTGIINFTITSVFGVKWSQQDSWPTILKNKTFTNTTLFTDHITTYWIESNKHNLPLPNPRINDDKLPRRMARPLKIVI